jgi:anti-sigma factor RsiW
VTDELLDAYLDGRLDEAQRREVEAELERDPALRGLVDLQGKIDGGVKRFTTPPDPKAILARAKADLAAERAEEAREDAEAAAAKGKVVKGPWGRRAIVALAACLLVALGLAFLREPAPKDYAIGAVASIYERRVAGGFQPDWVCKDDAEFEQSVSARLGRTVKLATTRPPGVEVLGLGYDGVVSAHGMVVLAHVDGRPVMVVVDKASADQPISLPAGSPLRLFRRQVQDLVLYEVTPFDDVRAIPALVVP